MVKMWTTFLLLIIVNDADLPVRELWNTEMNDSWMMLVQFLLFIFDKLIYHMIFYD